MEYIRGINRKQSILFSELIEDYVEDNNPVRFIDAFVANLNLKDLVSSMRNSKKQVVLHTIQLTC